MSGGRPCGLPLNERWLADVSYLGTPPLGSRLRGNDGCATVLLRRNDGRGGIHLINSEQLHHVGRVAATAHPCYYLRMTTAPDAPTNHYQLPTMEHRCPTMSHFVPRCSTSDTNRGTPSVPFSGKVFHRPDRNGP